jgi:hypothetical protein
MDKRDVGHLWTQPIRNVGQGSGILMAVKKCIALRPRVIYDSQGYQ